MKDAIAKIIARMEAEGYTIDVELEATHSAKGVERLATVRTRRGTSVVGSANNWNEAWKARYHGHDFDPHSIDEIERLAHAAIREHRDTIDKMAATVAAEGKL